MSLYFWFIQSNKKFKKLLNNRNEILGIGVDVVNNRRIQPLIKNQNFIKRTLDLMNLNFLKIKLIEQTFLQKRFAAKRSFIKIIWHRHKR